MYAMLVLLLAIVTFIFVYAILTLVLKIPSSETLYSNGYTYLIDGQGTLHVYAGIKESNLAILNVKNSSDYVQNGETYTVTADIANYTAEKTEPVKIQFIITTPDGAKNKIDQILPIPADGLTANLKYTVPEYISTGGYFSIRCEINSQYDEGSRVVQETDYSDNIQELRIKIADVLDAGVKLISKKYVIGGHNGKSYINSVEEYNPATNTWTIRASMAYVRSLHEAVVADGKIYAIGGYDGKSSLNSVEEYNPATNIWTTKAAMTNARKYFQATLVNEKIYAIGGYSGSAFLNLSEEYTPEYLAPTNLTAVAGNAKINLSWTASKNAISYTIKRSTKSGGSYTTIATVPTPTYTDTSVTNGTTYYYMVSAAKNDVESSNSAEVSAKPADITKAPTNLTAKAENAKVSLSWTASEGTVSYNIKRSAVQGGSYTTIGTSSTTNYTDTTVVNGSAYYYVVSAVSSTGESENSNEAMAKPIGIAATPTNLTAKAENAKVCLSWTASEGAASYNIKRSAAQGGSYTTIGTSLTATYTDTTAENGNIYYYVVSAVSSTGESANSNEVPGKPISISDSPQNLIVIADKTKISLSWTASKDAKSYNIKRSTVAGGTYATIATGSAITYTDTTTVNGTTYYYVVSALDSSNVESANSNEVSAKLSNTDEMLEVVSVDKAKVGDEITANIVIHNAVNICAEDIKISFDTARLQFISAEGADGIKIYKEDDLTEGIKRYITASLGKSNAANGDKMLLKFTFKAKAPGEAKIDITNGRIADNATLEKDIKEENCGEKTILIEGNVNDVNRSGEFTLLNLGIDAWYYGEKAANTDTSKYDADVVENGTIDDDDLSEIVKQMLNNSNYPAATKG